RVILAFCNNKVPTRIQSSKQFRILRSTALFTFNAFLFALPLLEVHSIMSDLLLQLTEALNASFLRKQLCSLELWMQMVGIFRLLGQLQKRNLLKLGLGFFDSLNLRFRVHWSLDSTLQS